MATYYVTKSGNDSNDGLSEGNAKLTIADAISDATSNSTGTPHTIIVSAGTYSENITLTGTSNLADATVKSETGNWDDVIITSTATATVAIGGGCTIRDVTIKNTAAAANDTKYAVWGSVADGMTYHCKLYSNNRGYYASQDDHTIERCIIESTQKATTQADWGIWQPNNASIQTKVYACLLVDWNWAQIYNYGQSDVVHTTVQTTVLKNSSLRGIYAKNVINSITHNDSGTNGWGGITGNTVGKYCIAWGYTASNDFRSNGSTSNNHTTTDVTSNGEQFVDEDNDNFRIRAGSLGVASGLASQGPTHDLVGRPYDTSNPSIGCYQYAWGAAGGKKLAGVDRDVIQKIAGVASTKIAKRNGQG